MINAAFLYTTDMLTLKLKLVIREAYKKEKINV
jgi:hypothetical protein